MWLSINLSFHVSKPVKFVFGHDELIKANSYLQIFPFTKLISEEFRLLTETGEIVWQPHEQI